MTGWTEGSPEAPGWYPILMMWDAEEGIFPNAGYWTGEKWEGDTVWAVIQYWPLRCDSQKVAKDTAYEHDPDLI
jgi:hypothetical protein